MAMCPQCFTDHVICKTGILCGLRATNNCPVLADRRLSISALEESRHFRPMRVSMVLLYNSCQDRPTNQDKSLPRRCPLVTTRAEVNTTSALVFHLNQCCLILVRSTREWIDLPISLSASFAFSIHTSDFWGLVILNQSDTPRHTRNS